MSIQAVLGKIEFSANKPFRKRRFPFHDFSPSLLPGKFLRLARPEFVRLPDRLAIHALILREIFDPRFGCEFLRRFKDPLLLQMGFDVAVVDLHSLIVAIIAAQVCRASAPLAVSINWQGSPRRPPT